MVKLTPASSAFKTLTISLQTPQETLQSTPVALPTSEPSAGNEQITYTVQNADLPTFNVSPAMKVWVANVIAAGKFVTAGTLSYRMKRNGVSVATGTGSVNANLFYTRLFCFFNVQVGDVLKIALWSNRSDSNWDYNAFFVYPTRLTLNLKNRLLMNVTYSNIQAVSLSLGNPHISNNAVSYLVHDDTLSTSIAEGQTITFLYNGKTNNYGLFRISHGDYVNADGSPTHFTDATYRPAYWREDLPTQITFRALDLPTP
ncbi:MAG: hypothetical protein NWE98_00375 [Candidatus Bathyarchaeota archaeon]|nr:hypothetical protein [Candidatus Bathyarchaeota archaeon]